MGWENIIVRTNIPNIPQSFVIKDPDDWIANHNDHAYYHPETKKYWTDEYIEFHGTYLSEISFPSVATPFIGDSTDSFTFGIVSAGSSRDDLILRLHTDNTDRSWGQSIVYRFNGSIQSTKLSFYALVNEDTRKIAFGIIYQGSSSGNYQYGYPSGSTDSGYSTSVYQQGDADAYEIITNSRYYKWHAVESIEGKLGVFDLTKIFENHINDGDPVSNANITNVDTGDDSVVMNLIKNVISNDDLVTVYYTIPQNDYQYVKLVYKKDTEPANENDGTVINIDEESTNHIVSGITTGDVYWFVIFTDKDKSIPYQFGTNKTIWAGEEIDLMYRGNYCKLTVQIANEYILFKMYDHSNVIYSWNAMQGTTVDDAYNIYVQFAEETTQQLAKPSMVYYDNGSYSYNQESPSQSEMQDIWNWLHGDD